MGMKAIFSNRLYKHKIDPDFVMSMDHTLRVFNQAKHFRYQAEVRELRGLKKKSSVSIRNKKEQISAVKRKIKATKARLTTLQKRKGSFVKGTPT
ncbi:hypothetical protein, partial [Halolactibacillus alkaliphilus]